MSEEAGWGIDATGEITSEGGRDVFENHVAKLEKYGEHLETLEWKNPESSTYAIWYVRQYSTLMVWGDCYEATYQWSYQKGIDLRWMAGCNLGYFVGKCRASQHGMDPRVFDYKTLRDNMKEYFAEGCTSNEPMCPEGECESCDLRRKEEKLFEENYGWNNMEDEYTWVVWLRDNGDEVFGADWWESVPSGMTLGPCVKLHLEGLKRAYKFLDKE